MKIHFWYGRRLGGVVCILLWSVHAAQTATEENDWKKCIQSVPKSLTKSQQEHLCAHDRRNHHQPTIPGECAKVALGGRPARGASRVETIRAASITQLCSGVRNIGPAECWAVFPARFFQQVLSEFDSSIAETNADSGIAFTPLIRVCKNAQDDRPAQCLLLWFKMRKASTKHIAREALDIVVALCKRFDGHKFALKQCIKQASLHMRNSVALDAPFLQLCQFIGDGKKLPAIMECVSNLKIRKVTPEVIARICSKASDVIKPHTCLIEAQQKLRWMSQDAQLSLCKSAVVKAAIAPVKCAMEIKAMQQRLLPTNAPVPQTTEYGLFAANLCQNATDTMSIIACVRDISGDAFTTDQILRLCTASTMSSQLLTNADAASHYPTRCATQTRSLLQRAMTLTTNKSSSLGMSVSAAAVYLCANATSYAPIKCLADTQRDQALSPDLRVLLCHKATSNFPQLCLSYDRKFVSARRFDIYDAVIACQRTDSLGPANCLTELFRATVSVRGKIAAELCNGAMNVEPARCFIAFPAHFDDQMKLHLCNQAKSATSALCADSVINRFANQPQLKVSLCRGATTAAPAACAIEAPFGMDGRNVVELCHSAKGTAPAMCAQKVPVSWKIPWNLVAQVCADAVSTTPGRCLMYHVQKSRVYRRVLDDSRIKSECRHAVAIPIALKFAKALYNCPKLQPICALLIVVNAVDQYGGDFIDSGSQVSGTHTVYVTAAFTDSYDESHKYDQDEQPTLHGRLYANMINGSAVFRNMFFTGAGVFTLTFYGNEGFAKEVVRITVHPDFAAEALQNRCLKLFTRFQCSTAFSKYDYQSSETQILLLPHGLQISAIACGHYWNHSMGGLVFSGYAAHNHVLYAIPRRIYELFTSVDIPRAGMSAWALLGLREGENGRTVIRRAYHQRSLQWHPDKWNALVATLPSVWQRRFRDANHIIRIEFVMQETLVAILRGIRNGSLYGTKVRAPHAMVMIFLFHNGSFRKKIRDIVHLTFEHSKNLALFVGAYKSVLAALRVHQE
ncbi:PXMP4, PMP24 [Plasmopara halstedii]|uniref:PXMP4, PMP24 n=1 Tax=Plasmopara halstedii TaxID=4781 RepID=A0A0P1B6Q5_PLAHL|nr:PXMP4, PMP24 [Plasmopara halstedii]CEG50457.1 PXMP4, PMP24 [Plasmopara halstedii]|eukprot:XP_024586826.1 PXMP4, PMP24 [Plasmopara halstedii]